MTMAIDFANYYRAHKVEFDAEPSGAISTAFAAFKYGEAQDPLAYFPNMLGSHLYSYQHAYTIVFSQPVPPAIVPVIIDYLGTVYDRSDADGVDNFLIYITATYWTEAFAKLKILPIVVRKIALKELEAALSADEYGDNEVEALALQHVNEAKQFFGNN